MAMQAFIERHDAVAPPRLRFWILFVGKGEGEWMRVRVRVRVRVCVGGEGEGRLE